MQPLKITIYGDFWDCQIYMGRLYLWTMDGDVLVCKWDKLIDSLTELPEDKLAMNCAFTNGNYLYGGYLVDIFYDREFRDLLREKFCRLSDKQFVIDIEDIQKNLHGKQTSPFKELPTDTEIFNKNLYGITDAGLWVASIDKPGLKHSISTKPKKIWDCSLLSMRANSYAQISLSGGSSGLFEFYPNAESFESEQPSSLRKVESNILQVSEKHSLFSNYSFLSIYNSSDVSESYMAIFNWEENKNKDEKKYRRKFCECVNDDEIFSKESHGISWGSGDKLYRSVDGGVDIVEFTNKRSNADKKFSNPKRISIDQWKGNVVSGGVAYFGALIECENALVVSLSDDTCITINGPVTKWRVYPRSKNYENHLHVILEDKIEIYSFNNDYFVDQKSKKFGMIYDQNKQYSYRNQRDNFQEDNTKHFEF